MKQKISPFLWFDKEAGEAARIYASVFKDSKITGTTALTNTPSGGVEIVSAVILGQEFTLMSAGPFVKFTPAVSFLVACSTKEEVEALWKELAREGSPLMELGAYPFSERYGWIQDRYGLSWQIMLAGGVDIRPSITLTLMFVGKQCGKAEEAVSFYASVFHGAKVNDILRYGKNQAPDQEGTVQHVSFSLEGQEFAAMDSAAAHKFTFNEAISFVVHCEAQEEIDHYWDKLSADPAAEQCGWLKDKYGLSWQIEPNVLSEMLQDKDAGKVGRVRDAFLKMKKLDIELLKRAYEAVDS
jgi:predicted 3-demethylubiquinone-9 3-methyltransferase (glyoxalase superfamily)